MIEDWPHGRHVEVAAVEGNATETELRALEIALERLVERQRGERTPSMWLRAGRAQGRRLGMLDYRDRFSRDDAWRLSTRFAFGGREYPGLNGRGDAR